MLYGPKTPALRRWRIWAGALLIAEVGWFVLMRPPFSGHLKSILVLSLIPVAVVGYVYLLASVAAWLDRLNWDYQMRQVIVIMLGLSVGFFVSVLSAVTTAQLEAASSECRNGGCEQADAPAE
jgi:hypothetical protein